MYIPNHSHRPSLPACLAAMVLLAAFAAQPAAGQAYGGMRGRVQQNLERGRGSGSSSARPGETAKKGSEAALTSEEQKRIATEQDADKLVIMAQEFLIANKENGARLCLDRATKAMPALLTADKVAGPPSSKEWASFWYAYKAKYQEKQLEAKDAAGRVKIAEWLHKVGEDNAARDFLKAALKISKDDPDALKRMEEWNLGGDAGLHVDLLFGLSQPLLPETVSDEGEQLEPRRDQRFMFVPFVYDPGDSKLQITSGVLKAKSDDDKSCRIVGVMLLLASGSGPGGATSRATGLQLQQPSDPILEQVEAQRTKDGSIELTTYNRIRPKSKRETGTTGGRSSRGSTPRPAPGEGRQTVAGSGYALFLVEVPMSAQAVQVTCRTDPPAKLDFELLNQLGKVGSDLQPSERNNLIDALVTQTTSEAPCVASAAIAGLATLREKSATAARDGGTARPGADRRDAATQKLEKAMLAGLESASSQVRRETFAAFVNSPAPLSLASLSTLWSEKKTAPALYLLDQVENILQTAALNENPTAGGSMLNPSDDRTQKLIAMVTELPASPATPNAFSVLGACLGSGIAEVYQRSLDLILAYPSQQSLVALADIPKDAAAVRTALIERLAKVTENDVKVAAMRIMLSTPDEGTMLKLLEACEGTKTALTGPEDPILRAFLKRPSTQAQIKLVELLGRSDLSKVASDDTFASILKSLSANAASDPGLQAALLKLARGQFRVEYQAPIHRGQGLPAVGGTGGTGKGSAPELLLATLATTPKGDPKAAQEAAKLLIGAGRLSIIEDQLRQAKPEERLRLIQTIGGDKELAKREALAIFLARRLADQDERVAAAAINALAEVYKNADTNQRWRLDLAVKTGVDAKEILRLAQSKDTKVARAAMSLVRQLGKMTASESDQIQSSDPGTREQKYAAFNDQRGTKPSGAYQCVVYLDVKSSATPTPVGETGAEASPEESDGAPSLTEGTGLPLPDLRLTVQPEGTRSFGVVLDGRDLTIMAEDDSGGSGRGAAPPASGPIVLKIDAAPILLEALKKAQDQKVPFAALINQFALNDRLPCELRHEQLGTWGAELQLLGGGGQRGADPETPLEITGGKIYIELVDPGK